MKDVKRYSEHDGEGGGVCPAKDGRFVTFLDYDLLGRKSQSKIDLLSNKLAAETLRADTAEADYRELSAENDSLLFRASAAEQRVSELLALLKKSSEIFWAVQDDLGAISASAVGVMWGKIDAALNPKPEAGSHAK